ncbi:MAG: DNA primase [Calditrichia bacterium]
MARIPEHIIDRVRESSDIVEVISRYISLKKRGKSYLAKCPFHTEKTPSFSVAPDKQIFYCFGCGAGGNVFNFVMRYEKITFIEAVKKLAEERGIKLPSFRQDPEEESETERLFRANRFAADFFQEELKTNFDKIGSYLQNRGIKSETIQTFQIGYSPEGWTQLYDEVNKRKMGLAPFIKLGLVLQSEKQPGRYYDRFRGRLIFPIHNTAGRIVGFGGRIMKDDPRAPKYLNSPESDIYQKSEVLYGLFQSKQWIRQEEFAIFVEGYMDFLQLFQNGIKNVVATSGTALTDEQAKLIRRFTRRTILCYDADSAGIKAAARGGEVLIRNDLEVQVLLLPKGDDPDSYVRQNGASAFRNLLANAMDFFEFKIWQLSGNRANLSVNQKAALVNALLDTISEIPDPLKQSFYVNMLSERFAVPVETLSGELSKITKSKRVQSRFQQERQAGRSKAPQNQPVLTGAWAAERDLLTLMIRFLPQLRDDITEILEPEDFLNPPFQDIYRFILETDITSPDTLQHAILARIEDPAIAGILSANLMEEIVNPERYLLDCLEKIKMASIENQIEQIKQNLKNLEAGSAEFTEALSTLNKMIMQQTELKRAFREQKAALGPAP